MVNTDSQSLTARQRARKANERKLAEAKQREEALATVFAALDQRDELDARVGRALRAVVAIDGTNGAAGDLVGLTARQVGDYIRAADAADTVTHDSTDADENTASSEPAATASHDNDSTGSS